MTPPDHAYAIKFESEERLVQALLVELRERVTRWGEVATVTEWDYRSGFTDVLARNSDRKLIAFEAKLRDWRRAAEQAYRNTSFADEAYVVLPSAAARLACASPEVFRKYGVGLCVVDGEGLRVLIEARERKCLLIYIQQQAQVFFDALCSEDAVPTGTSCSDSECPPWSLAHSAAG